MVDQKEDTTVSQLDYAGPTVKWQILGLSLRLSGFHVHIGYLRCPPDCTSLPQPNYTQLQDHLFGYCPGQRDVDQQGPMRIQQGSVRVQQRSKTIQQGPSELQLGVSHVWHTHVLGRNLFAQVADYFCQIIRETVPMVYASFSLPTNCS
jgi:hypothetical protein|uniref:Uncharacterized protein n=1 Tax=Eutreptiella gymnastica TaxID=73025 RepID=A0A7S4LHS5_9EUGL|mmetsp:Transcript_74510/g.125584  ORF Transcript_74510/g.125584 Transcript_74510/m.125584 type:complete len:149 (+) Transcript_74510:713-1159(+)